MFEDQRVCSWTMITIWCENIYKAVVVSDKELLNVTCHNLCMAVSVPHSWLWIVRRRHLRAAFTWQATIPKQLQDGSIQYMRCCTTHQYMLTRTLRVGVISTEVRARVIIFMFNSNVAIRWRHALHNDYSWAALVYMAVRKVNIVSSNALNCAKRIGDISVMRRKTLHEHLTGSRVARISQNVDHISNGILIVGYFNILSRCSFPISILWTPPSHRRCVLGPSARWLISA